MHFLFSLLRIKGLYMFLALLAHLQELLHKRHSVYCVHVMSVGCTRMEASASILVQPTDITACVVPPEDTQVMLETCRGPKLLINWIKSTSHWFYYTDILRCMTLSFQIYFSTCSKICCMTDSKQWYQTFCIVIYTKQFMVPCCPDASEKYMN
jgi:hypothetical protein